MVGGDSKASTVAKTSDQQHAALHVMGVVLMRVTLRAISSQEVAQIFKLRILRAGCTSWTGILLGAPALDQSPLGLGHRATLGGHVLAGLGIVLPRLEEHIIQQGLEGVQIALSSPPAHEVLGCSTVPDTSIPLISVGRGRKR